MSLKALEARITKLSKSLAELEQRRQVTQGEALTTLPKVDQWPEFAKRTWIATANEKGATIAPFVPYHYQEHLVGEINAHDNIIICKSRQLGISETICSYLLNRAVTEPGFSAVVFSKTQADSSQLAVRVRRMANSLHCPELHWDSDSKTILSFTGLGQIFFLPASERAARGIPACSVLFLDEAAFCEGVEAIYGSASATLSLVPNAKVIVNSTPSIPYDFYGTLWHDNLDFDWEQYVVDRRFDELNERFLEIDDGWRRVAYHYEQHPVYSNNPKWIEKTKTKRKLTERQWGAEYELRFSSTDAQVFPLKLIQQSTAGELLECGLVNRSYVMGIDPNAGGDDYFCAVVLDITDTPRRVVGLYRENLRSTRYSLQKVRDLIELFDPVRIVVEKQAMGAVIAEALEEHLPSYEIETFNTSRPSKITITDRILYLMEQGDLVFPDGPVPHELRTFTQLENGAREAASGHHDDAVMALAFACSRVPEEPALNPFFANL